MGTISNLSQAFGKPRRAMQRLLNTLAFFVTVAPIHAKTSLTDTAVTQTANDAPTAPFAQGDCRTFGTSAAIRPQRTIFTAFLPLRDAGIANIPFMASAGGM